MTIDFQTASQKLASLGSEFVVIKNPQTVFPEYEVVPISNQNIYARKKIPAVVMDMDGTTTTTEILCLFSLQLMIRKMSGNYQFLLDKEVDYPHIIGNSTTKHVEYLINKYKKMFDVQQIWNNYFEAAAWSLFVGEDEGRKNEIVSNLKIFGLSNYLVELSEGKCIKYSNLPSNIFPNLEDNNLYVLLGVDIYYKEYHEMLHHLKNANGNAVRRQIYGNEQGGELIVPMEGVSVLIPMIKGWLGADIEVFVDELIEKSGTTNPDKEQIKQNLIAISNYFEQNPAKLALVTSSILHEAKIVLGEVYRVIAQQINQSGLSAARKQQITEKLSDYSHVYDVIVTATDSNEIRLKPHRDLYSIALNKMGIAKADFFDVLGFEDSESGVTAIRAAGIGTCIAVPFADTSGHKLDLATFIAPKGIPQVLVDKNMYLAV